MRPPIDTQDIVYRLLKRAEIRRSIPTRKSVENGEPDRIADILEEAAKEIVDLRHKIKDRDRYIALLRKPEFIDK